MRETLAAKVAKHEALGAAGVIANVKTGEILSMVSLPDFDPANPSTAKPDHLFNRASVGVYEMGSTFKSFTMALALEKGVTHINEGYDATNPLHYANFTIKDFHAKKRWLSVPEIYVYSSNIGTAKMILDVGKETQQVFMRDLGMMEPVKIELPEKASPLLPGQWQDINAITISYGHGMSVTPLHLVRGIASLVNGGVLVPLTLTKQAERATRQGKLKGKRVISEQTSASVRDLMRLVVKYGTGKKAAAEGYLVGGKTGTSEKINARGRYQDDAKLTSFVAAFPMDDPQYVVFVMVDEPKPTRDTYGYATGGWIAAPVVKEVIERMAPLYGLKPKYPLTEHADQYWPEAQKIQQAKPAPTPAVKPSPYFHAIAY